MVTASLSAPPQGLAHTLAQWAYSLHHSDAPEAVRQALRNCLVYNFSMALAVDPRDDALGTVLGEVARETGPARLFGGRGCRSAEDAAFLNAGLITARGQNDTHPDVVTHIGCIVIPAVFALADEFDAALPDVLDALLVGYEIIPRLAQALAIETNRRGFRGTPLYGVLGAAVACARVLKLPPARAAAALAIATQYASGTLQPWMDGSQEWRLQIAKASRDAVTSALLARAGMQGAAHCLEGESGFALAFAGKHCELDFAGWRLPEIAFKLYPGCAFNQSPVHALRELLDRPGVDATQIVALHVSMNPFDAAYPGIVAYGPFSSPSGAIMSAPFMLAATLQDGQPRTAHFNKSFADEHLCDRSKIVSIHADEDIPRWACKLVATLADGSTQTSSCDGNFVLDKQQTRRLASGVSREWTGSDVERRFDTLTHVLDQLDSPKDWHKLSAAAYDRDLNDSFLVR